jgi:hypothetical protein
VGHKSADCWWLDSGKPADTSNTRVHATSAEEPTTIEALYSAETSWCMAITDEKHCCGYQAAQGYEWGLIDSGSAVTAVGWEVGKQLDTVHVGEAQQPRLTNVSGTGIRYYGRRMLKGSIMTNDGEKRASMDGDVAEVNKMVISVSSLSDKGFGTWFPPRGMMGYKLIAPDGTVS